MNDECMRADAGGDRRRGTLAKLRAAPISLGAAAALLFTSPAARAQTGEELIEAMAELDSQLNQLVVSSTKSEQRANQAPAVVTVINAEEIRARGYTSIADVLRVVPGFYDVYDLSTHNVGIRGINGGARASGNVLKLMIDGHPVDFRPTTGNFFGEELIPLAAVERVEVIRGPASALYGANAFLGVVNIITRHGSDVGGARLIAQGAAVRDRPGGGGQVLLGGGAGDVDVMLAGSFYHLDRSGLPLPTSSPVLDRELTPVRERGASQNDLARPRSLLAKVTADDIAGGKLTLLGSIQSLETAAEFQDYGPLTHRNRVALQNQNYRATYELQPLDNLDLFFSGHYFHGRPSGRELFDLGRTDYHLLRRVGVDGFGFSAEGKLDLFDRLTLTQGLDFVEEHHLLQSFDQLLLRDVTAPDGSVLRRAGTVLPGPASGARQTFRNLGGFVQAQFQASDSFGLVGGARIDGHSIYGINPSGRAGVVYAPADRPFSAKLLYGSSFKAPSAVQLYSQPMALLDARGSPDLKPQTAHTVELAGGYLLPGSLGEISVNLFASVLFGRVAFVQRGLYQEAQNVQNEQIVGGEAEARLRLHRSLDARLGLGVARTVQLTTDEQLARSSPRSRRTCSSTGACPSSICASRRRSPGSRRARRRSRTRWSWAAPTPCPAISTRPWRSPPAPTGCSTSARPASRCACRTCSTPATPSPASAESTCPRKG